MTLVERMRTLDWWMWGVSLALLVVGLLGWYTGLYVLVLLSALQVAYFFWRAPQDGCTRNAGPGRLSTDS